ncbi:LexA family protein [Maridesulfovibrio hydrothermalis]|uniref:DNA polymerase V, subunit D n=1 Tax=Maridesulfovibrio hydrothermalis AM13 = DSM 14728 TaxID=1121451 RepID=L0RDG6_9BACT|nr:translesion error-prone DNA polymerase V autoproteolytic subunit [Maridesulfovibrio hydrothermalis]CCO24789.1 DNA polymerase V, subunit D [Maridesulfovibrio hydrothermalis AM13 = DSM 14728]
MNPNCVEILKPEILNKTELPFFLSEVAAGFPSPADDYIDKKMDLNEHLIKHPAATFFVRAYGDSMQDANISQGDILIVDRAVDACHNTIVIAVYNGELTVKRLKQEGQKLYLAPENKNYPRLEVTEETSFEIWGVVTYIIHKAGL